MNHQLPLTDKPDTDATHAKAINAKTPANFIIKSIQSNKNLK